MTSYRRIWQAVCTLAVLTGTGLVILTLPPGATATYAGVSAALGALAYRRWLAARPEYVGTSAGYLRVATLSAAAGLGSAGWILGAGAAGALLVAMCVAGSPQAVAWCRRQPGAGRDESRSTPDPARAPASNLASPEAVPPPARATVPGARGDLGDFSSMPAAELVLVWRWSYVELGGARSPAELAALGEVRRHCLDELERRWPEGFRRWMADGARAASDPSRYLEPSSPRDPDGT